MHRDATAGPVATAYARERAAWEDSWLSEHAAHSYPARRARAEEDCALRTPLQRDRDRIVHCKAFRRLKHKTQVFVAPEGDHYRTRLTHTLEVTQISRTVARALRLNEDVVDAILCHSGRAPLPRTLEGRIVRLVDRVAYINHDIDDAVRAGVLDPASLPVEPIAALGDTGSQRIDTLVHDLVEHSADAGDIVQGEAAGGAMDALRTFMFDEVYLSDTARREQAKIDAVIRTLFEHHVAHPETLPHGDGDLAQRVTDWIAGMTDRYCIRAFEGLSVPNAFAL